MKTYITLVSRALRGIRGEFSINSLILKCYLFTKSENTVTPALKGSHMQLPKLLDCLRVVTVQSCVQYHTVFGEGLTHENLESMISCVTLHAILRRQPTFTIP
jgi:hypothetical protein